MPPPSPVQLNDPLFATVESDIVGYTTISMEAGKWYQIGCPFVTLEEGATVTINDLISLPNDSINNRDFIGVMNPATCVYKLFYWNSTARGGQGAFCDNVLTSTPSTVQMSKGQTVFFKPKKDCTVTFSGRVTVDTSLEIGSEEGQSWNQFCIPYPETIKINDLQWTGISANDLLAVLNTDTCVYKFYYWKAAANAGRGGWCDNVLTTTATQDTLAPGQGVLLKKREGIASVSYTPTTQL